MQCADRILTEAASSENHFTPDKKSSTIFTNRAARGNNQCLLVELIMQMQRLLV
jgi:hypothetical protein